MTINTDKLNILKIIKIKTKMIHDIFTINNFIY